MKKNYYVVILILFVFFVISFLTNIMGPLVPEIIEDFNLSLTMVALLPFAFFVAYGVFSIPSGIWVERYGEQKVMVWAFFIAFIGAISLAVYPNYLVAIISLFFIGSGMAMLQVAINPLLRTAGGEEHFAFYSVLGQMFFSLASFLSPLAYSYLVLNLEGKKQNSNFLLDTLAKVVPENLSWISMYWLFAVIALLMVVLVQFSRLPKVELKEDEKIGTAQTIMILIKKPIVLLYLFAIFFYVGTEQGINNWVSEFLQTYHGADPQTTGATVISRFWLLMFFGTLLGLLLLKFVDSRKVLIGFTLAAIISLTFALFGGLETAVIAFPMVGFFASVMWSILISLALNSVAEHHGTIAGIMVTGSVGGAIWPLIIGSIGDFIGLKAGMLILYLSLGYVLAVGFWAEPLISNKTVSLGKKE